MNEQMLPEIVENVAANYRYQSVTKPPATYPWMRYTDTMIVIEVQKFQ
jgi:hypothetical protein